MDYVKLTNADKRALLEQRLGQYEAQHYETGLNLLAVEAAGQAAERHELQAQMDQLVPVIEKHRELLAELAD